MKLFKLLFSICVVQVSFAQQLLPIQHDTNTYAHEIIVQGVADYGSTSLNNELTNKFLFGGYISNDIKDRSFDRHVGINRFGLDMNAEIEYRNLKVNTFGNEKWGFTVKAGYYNFASLLYSKDLFGLAFYGNERYLGENANFSGSQFTAWGFQKVGFGLIDKKSKSNVSLNFYSVNNYANATVRDGQLFQTASFDSVSLVLDGQFEYAGANQFVKGFGFGIDLDFRIPVEIRPEQVSYIQFLAKNVGFARINSTVTRYSVDTTFTFDGLTFDQLYGDNAILNDNFSFLDTLGIDSVTTTRTTFLPGYLQVGKIVDEMNPKRIQGFYGVRMYPTITFVPMLYAGAQVKALKWLDMGLNLSYGGFTQFRVGLYAQFKVKQFYLGLSSENLAGIVSANSRGQSFAIRLRCKF